MCHVSWRTCTSSFVDLSSFSCFCVFMKSETDLMMRIRALCVQDSWLLLLLKVAQLSGCMFCVLTQQSDFETDPPS